MQVKLVAVLDVEHEISSVQILHHEEEVLLDTKFKEVRARSDSPQMSSDGTSMRGLHLSLEGAVKVREERILPS